MLLAVLLTVSWNVAYLVDQEKPYSLMLGDPAPKLEASSWIGEPVPTFVPGKVYVLDFFATWCGPCRDSMPAMSALQNKHKEEVTFIAVDVWDYQDRVAPFVKEMGEKLSYRVALDKLPGSPPAGTTNVPMWGQENGASSKAWMNASGMSEAGIPTVFVIDQNGRVAWIGDDPKELAGVLDKVIAGKWDLAGEAKKYFALMSRLKPGRMIEKEFRTAQTAKDYAGQVSAADRLIAFGPEYHHYAGTRFQTTLLKLKKKDEAYDFARAQLKTNTAIGAFGQMAYVIVFMSTPIGADDLDLAEALAAKANEMAKGERPSPLETLAKIAFLRGDKAKAVDFQTRAIAKIQNADSKKEAEQRLAEYKGSSPNVRY